MITFVEFRIIVLKETVDLILLEQVLSIIFDIANIVGQDIIHIDEDFRFLEANILDWSAFFFSRLCRRIDFPEGRYKSSYC